MSSPHHSHQSSQARRQARKRFNWYGDLIFALRAVLAGRKTGVLLFTVSRESCSVPGSLRNMVVYSFYIFDRHGNGI